MPGKFIPYGSHHVSEDDVQRVLEVLKSDRLTTGPRVEQFEKKLCGYTGASNAVAVNSGTSALDIAVGALELPAGSEIITTPFTFAASSNCAIYNNCRPVFADIDRKTYNIDPEQIRKKVTGKTKAIIYVDFGGQPCAIDEIREIAEEKGLYLIEDAAHALGAKYKGKAVGSFADMTVFSFHPVKHITTGEGGAVTTESEELHKKLKLLRNHGIDKTPDERTDYLYDMKMLGRNYRITDIQCALGISQLEKAEAFLNKREEAAALYNKELGKVDGVTVPYVKPDVRHAWHLYTILVDNRDAFFNEMKKRNIGVNVHYIPVYRFSYYRRFGIDTKEFPATEEVYSRIVTLPMFHSIRKEDVERVISAVEESVKATG